MGRKRTHHESARTKIVSARLKPETYDLISEHAEKLGLSRAGYIEHLIENRPLKVVGRMSDDLPTPLINELKRIGNNLNQIAHARNAGLPTDHGQYRTVLSQIITIMCRNEALKKRYNEASAEVSNAPMQEIERARAARPASPPPRHAHEHDARTGYTTSRTRDDPPWQPPAYGAEAPAPQRGLPLPPRSSPPATPPAGQRPPSTPAPVQSKPGAQRPPQPIAKPKHNDPKAASARSKFSWSLFVRPTRR